MQPDQLCGNQCNCVEGFAIGFTPHRSYLSLLAQRVKRLPRVGETKVRSLGQEDPLQKEMATHSSTLAWKIPWTVEHGRLQSTGSQRVGQDWATSLHLHLTCDLDTSIHSYLNKPSTYNPALLCPTTWQLFAKSAVSPGSYTAAGEYWRRSSREDKSWACVDVLANSLLSKRGGVNTAEKTTQ